MDINQNSQSDAVEVVTPLRPQLRQGFDGRASATEGLKMKKRKSWLWLKVVLGILIILSAVGGVGAFQGYQIYKQALNIKPIADKAQGNLAAQDLVALKETLQELQNETGILKSKYEQTKWVKFIPVAGAYWKDIERVLTAGTAGIESAQILTEAIEPYADILGFKGAGTFAGGTAEDRIIIALKTLEKITPKLDEVASRLRTVDENLQLIDEKRYNFSYQEILISDKLKKAKDLIHGATKAVTDAKPALELLPKLAGMEGEKKYMVLFHNDGELRGTGGFMTAYGIMKVDNGRVSAERSSDIYELDNKFKSRLQPPDLVKNLLKVPYWHLRDLNLSPDFKENMDLFSGYYGTIVGEPKINGVIGVDTKFLVDLLGLLGPIDVPGFGRFSNDNDPRCDCPQVVYQLEAIADRPVATLVENRKGVLGPMMRELILRAYGAPKPWWDDLFKIFIDNVNEKHVAFYFKMDQPGFEEAAEQLNAAGRVQEVKGDYLMVNDVNFGGAKANFFVKQEVTQNLEIAEDGTITKTLTVTYTNSSPASNCNLEAGKLCLNAPLPNWVRIYVPKDSQLMETVGLDKQMETTEELGKTVFQGFLTVSPQSSSKTIYKYKLPFKAKTVNGELLIQKQMGKDTPHYKIELPDRVEEFDLNGDKKFTFSW